MYGLCFVIDKATLRIGVVVTCNRGRGVKETSE